MYAVKMEMTSDFNPLERLTKSDIIQYRNHLIKQRIQDQARYITSQIDQGLQRNPYITNVLLYNIPTHIYEENLNYLKKNDFVLHLIKYKNKRTNQIHYEYYISWEEDEIKRIREKYKEYKGNAKENEEIEMELLEF